MAKKQVFGTEAQKKREQHRKMAKVIVSQHNGRGKFSYKEAIISQDDVKDFIAKNKD